jgi:hypothetical protein
MRRDAGRVHPKITLISGALIRIGTALVQLRDCTNSNTALRLTSTCM